MEQRILNKHGIYGLIGDVNMEEILSHIKDGDLDRWLSNWRAEMVKTADKIFEDVEEGTFHTNIYVRDRYSGTVHRVGEDVHDRLSVDENGTVHYENMQNGEGCIGFESLKKETIGEKYPDIEWENGRGEELCYGYEFVPCPKECEYCQLTCPWKMCLTENDTTGEETE